MLLFRNESFTTELEADDVVCVPDYIYAVVALEIDPSNTRFYVQVKLILDLMTKFFLALIRNLLTPSLFYLTVILCQSCRMIIAKN